MENIGLNLLTVLRGCSHFCRHVKVYKLQMVAVFEKSSEPSEIVMLTNGLVSIFA